MPSVISRRTSAQLTSDFFNLTERKADMKARSAFIFSRRWVLRVAMSGTVLALGGFASGAWAQVGSYPTRTITMVVNFAAGGATDLAARALAEHLRQKLDQTVVVENMTGGSTSIGTGRVARAPKDGYTLLFSTASTFSITPHLRPQFGINLDDFDVIARVGSIPFALAARKDFPGTNLNEFIAAAKARPKGVNNATPGAGSVSDMLSRYVYGKFGVPVEGVHYRGESVALVDLVAGRTDTLFVTPALALPHLNSGTIKAIATTGVKRSPMLPNVPTFTELGYPDLFGDSWQIVMAAAGTPAPIVTRLNVAINEVMVQPSFIEALTKLGAEAVSAKPDEIRKQLRDEHKRWGTVITENKITVE